MKQVSKAVVALALAASPMAFMTAYAATSTSSGASTPSTSVAASASSVLYVSPTGNDKTADGSNANPYLTISAAVKAAVNGATILVEPGTYKEMVVITKPVTLEADAANNAGPVVIDATGKANAVLVKGSGANGTVIQNLTLENANHEGLLAVGPLSNLVISGNTIENNVQAKLGKEQTFEALHLMGVSNSTVINNLVDGNKDGGIYLTDESGPNYGNVVSQNTVENNAIACGITLASHVKHSGVHDNTITDNTVIGNGASGIIMATPVPGGLVKNNTVSGNIVAENASGGIKLHTHAPGSVVSGNIISFNQISANAADQGSTKKPVGISIAASGSAITNTSVIGNTISNESFGIYNQNNSASVIANNIDKAVAKAVVTVKAKIAVSIKVGSKK